MREKLAIIMKAAEALRDWSATNAALESDIVMRDTRI